MDRAVPNGIIISCHENGFTTGETRNFLNVTHDYQISLSHLKRLKKQLGLTRHRQVNGDAIANVIQEELNGSGRLLGYRAMWNRLRVTHQINASQHTIRELLGIMDPEGVDLRSRHRLQRRQYVSQGPLYCIHVDGYDKMKEFGFSVHGCIDGFSRKILWLRVGRTNNKPEVVAGYFLDFLREFNGTARKIRFDAGTENGLIEDMQKTLRWEDTDDSAGSYSVLIGRSVSNQRIERWWGILRNSSAQFWINLFKDLVAAELFNSRNELQRECLRFGLMRLIQKELNQVKREWNLHRMQRSRFQEGMSGKPDVIFSSPVAYGGHLYQYPVTEETIEELEPYVIREHEDGTTLEYLNIFREIIADRGLQMPESADEALTLYGTLIDAINV